MDMGKVFHDKEQIPSHLLAKVGSSRLKVGLCEECVCLIKQFSDNNRKLEKAEMKLTFCLRQIHAKILNANDNGKREDFKRSAKSEADVMSGGGGELEIVEVLREEAIQKSHNKLRAVMPRVEFYNLSKKEIRRAQLKFQANNDASIEQQKTVFPASIVVQDSSKSQLGTLGIKMKFGTPDAYFSHDDDNGNYSSDGSNPHDEDKKDDAESTNLKMEEQNVNITKGTKKQYFSTPIPKYPRKSRIDAQVRESSVNLVNGKYKCGTCSREFFSKFGFKQHHKNVHMKIRFKCVTCGKQYSDRSACNRHQKSAHLNVRFKCVTCGKLFTDRTNFKRHQKNVHDGVRYACQVCHKSFTDPSSLSYHQRKTDCGKKRLQLSLSTAI